MTFITPPNRAVNKAVIYCHGPLCKLSGKGGYYSRAAFIAIMIAAAIIQNQPLTIHTTLVSICISNYCSGWQAWTASQYECRAVRLRL